MKQEGIHKVTAGLQRPQDKGKDEAKRLQSQASKYYIFKQEVNLEAWSMHKCNVIHKTGFIESIQVHTANPLG